MVLRIFVRCFVISSCFFASFSEVRSETTNVALGALCCSSSMYSSRYSCEKALDGNTNTDYASSAEGVGLWMQIQLDRLYMISAVRIMDRVHHPDKNKESELLFNDGSSQQVTLGDFGEGHHWNSFDLDPVVALSVNITVLTVYTKNNNGFIEIELLGVPVDRPSAHNDLLNERSRHGLPRIRPPPGTVSQPKIKNVF